MMSFKVRKIDRLLYKLINNKFTITEKKYFLGQMNLLCGLHFVQACPS